MPEEIVMPRLSDTMEEGTIAQWLKREGEAVHKGEAILEVETDKATMELQAYSDGVIQKILQGDGTTVPIGAVVGILAKAGEATAPSEAEGTAPVPAAQPAQAAAPAAEGAASPPPPPAPQGNGSPQEAVATAQPPSTEAVGTDSGGNGRVKATPLARNLARQHNIDLVAINGRGSGPGGRIVKVDIERVIAQQGGVAAARAPQAAPAPAAPAAPAPPQPTPQPQPAVAASAEDVELRKPNRIQQVMARRLLEAKTTIPHFYVTNEVDMAAVMEMRKQLQATFGDEVKISFNHFIVRACALALRAMPEVNSSWQDGQFAVHKRVNVGIAVDLPEGGLVVPVIRDADRKTLRELAVEARELADKAYNGKLAPAEMQGATFTVSNLGSVVRDVEEFQAIINPPESAILAVAGIIEKPVVMDGQVVVRPRMLMTISVDHRVIPGVPAAQFLQRVKQLLQEPLRLGF